MSKWLEFALRADIHQLAFGSIAEVAFPKNGIYVWFAYHTPGHFTNNLVASAKSALTSPQQIPYSNKAKMRLKEFSMGWRKYLKGTPDAEKGWNVYAYAGLGLMLGRIENDHSVEIDTADYNVPVRNGRANFKRLTLDLGRLPSTGMSPKATH